MASISSLNLKLNRHDHNRKTATITVSYRAVLSSVERNMTGLRFREVIQLWGADSPDGDDYLYTFPTRIFSKESDGVVNREVTVTLSDDILDEDGFPRPTDEVYAKVRISPYLPSGSVRNSNQIEHRF
ncbi:MAG: hypothetical protein COB30_019580 [Ectothiorhodospiraceae bacterium]|nr:hypothetical protein [Ectothiorhodospiraceae bacterium]